MCGRYAASRNPDDLIEEFEIDQADVRERLAPDYNVAPTKPVYAVLDRSTGLAQEPQRLLKVLRWGLVPSWAKDRSIGSRLINARMETVLDKPAFRAAFASRRCLLPADGYYEWYGDKGKKGGRQPFFIRPKDSRMLAMAGLYEVWRDRTRQHDDPEALWWSCTILTTSAEDDLGELHDRMPLLVEPDRFDAWLNPRLSAPDELRSLLVPAAPGRLAAYPVSRAVNDVRNNGPQLIEALTPEPLISSGRLFEV